MLYLFGTYGAISLADFEKSIPDMGIHSGFGDEWLKIGGIKLFADGVPQTKTAWLARGLPGRRNGGLVLPGATDKERCDRTRQDGRRMPTRTASSVPSTPSGTGRSRPASTLSSGPRSRTPRGCATIWSIATSSPRKTSGEWPTNNIGVGAQPILKWVFSDDMDQGHRSQALGVAVPTADAAGCRRAREPLVGRAGDQPDWLQGVEAAVVQEVEGPGTVRGPKQAITVREAIRCTPWAAPGRTTWKSARARWSRASWRTSACSTATSSRSRAGGDPHHQQPGDRGRRETGVRRRSVGLRPYCAGWNSLLTILH